MRAEIKRGVGGICLILILLAGCQFRVPKDPYTFTDTLPTDPDRLTPPLSNSNYSISVYQYIYDTLIDLDPDTLEPIPHLAKRWDISKDGMVYTFYLREDVLWHDGKPFTADDVVFSYEKIMDPHSDTAVSRGFYQDIEKVEKIGPYVVRFTYKKPYFKALIILGLLRPFPKHIFSNGDFNSHPNNRQPIGNGPYRFVEWETGRKIVLERFSKYWGRPYPFQKMIFEIVPDDQITFQLFKKNELDTISLTALQWARQTNSENFSRRFDKHNFFSASSVMSYIGWNLTKPYFQDRRVREALAHLVNREYINEKLLFGLYYPVTGPFDPMGEDYNKNLVPLEYNPEKAAKLLSDAGWIDRDGDGVREKNGIPFQFTLLFSSGNQFYEELTPILQREFAKVGIKLELRRLEAITLFRTMQEKEFDAYMAAWGRASGEDDPYQIWHSSQIAGGSNYISYANPEVDRLLEATRETFDRKKRIEYKKKIHEILYTDQPYLFLFARPELFAHDRRFKNVKLHHYGVDMREWTIE